MKRSIIPTTALAALFLLGCGDDEPTGPEDALSEVRTRTAAFQNVSAANSAGYTVWSPDPTAANSTCPSNADGKMGYHLVNPGLRGSPADPLNGDAVVTADKPEMLLYEKRADGSLRLVGVEYLVFKAAWERVNGAGAAAPTVFGQPLLASRHAFTPGGAEIDHYELHVWLHTENPRGMFDPWNPNISC